ncbi:hypothetical protein QTN25_010421 [Entamoeba marina]
MGNIGIGILINGLIGCIGGLIVVVLIGGPLLGFAIPVYTHSQNLQEYYDIAPETFDGFRFAYKTGNWYGWYCFVTIAALAIISILSLIPFVSFCSCCVSLPIYCAITVFEVMAIILLVFGLQEDCYISGETVNEIELTSLEQKYECCFDSTDVGTRVCSGDYFKNCSNEVFEPARKDVKIIGSLILCSLWLLSLLSIHMFFAFGNFSMTTSFCD